MLDPLPEELDAIKIWSISSVPDYFNLEGWCYLPCWLLVNTGVIPEDRDLFMLAHLGS